MAPIARHAATDLRQNLVKNWPIKLTALVLSAVLWAVVAAEEPTTQLVPVHLVVTYANGQPVNQPLPPVRALYAGPARELIKLYAQPPVVQKIVPDSAVGSTVTVQLGVADLLTAVAVDVDVTPQDIQPRSVAVTLADLVERRVPVTLRVTAVPEPGHGLLGPIHAAPDSVTVRGPAAVVNGVEAISTLPLTLTGLTETVRRGIPLDTRGLEAVRLTPSQVVITIEVGPITERLFAGVPVRVHGVAPEDWEIAQPVVAVTMRGLAGRLAALNRDSITVVATVTGRRDSETVALHVIPPAGFTAHVSPDSVVVRRRPSG